MQQKKELELQLQGGTCVLLTYFVLEYLKHKFPNISIECATLDNHRFIVIGRDPDSDSYDISTWGKDAIICDPWAKLNYFASEFSVKQKNLPNITIILGCKLNRNGTYEVITSKNHYLMGEPCILNKEDLIKGLKCI